MDIINEARVLSPSEDKIIVFKFPNGMTSEEGDQIIQGIKTVIPEKYHHKILLLSDDIDINIIDLKNIGNGIKVI